MTVKPFTYEELDGDARVAARGSAASRAEAIIGQARAEAAAITAAAHQQGFAEGRAAGLEQIAAELAPARETLEAITRELVAEHDELLSHAERAAAELALKLAEKILHCALDVRPELVLEVVTGALRRVSERNAVVLEVNPADLELVRTSIEEIAGGFGGFASLEAIPERRVARGGCIVRMNGGEIDATLDAQLARAGELVREALN